jgi:RND family efflux transporter MFP subunit
VSTTEQTTITATIDSWENLSSTSSEQFHQSWLELQCSMVGGSYAAMLVVRGDDDAFRPVALWPAQATHLEQLSELVEHVIDVGSGFINPLPGNNADSGKAYGVAYPIMQAGRLYAVVALALVVNSEQQLQKAMRQLQWGGSWVELYSQRRQTREQGRAQRRLTAGVDVLAKVLAQGESAAASMRLVTELALLFACERVSIGFEKKGAMRLDQMSHSAQFGKRMNIIRAIETAMDEAVDQREVLIFPPSPNSNSVVLAHQAMAEQLADSSIMSVPLFHEQRVIGAVTLERDSDKPFTREDADYCESIASLAVTVLADKRENDKLLVWKITDAMHTQASRLIGQGYPGRKVVAIAVLGVVLFASLVHGTYRLSADATLESGFQRVVVAPYNGFIKEAPLRAGDVAKEGELIAALDDKDLHLERLKWLSQSAELKGQAQEATAAHDRAKLMVIQAQIEQAQAQLQLVESQLERAAMRAPFDGLIVSGDMSQRLGGAISQGEELFEISPLDAYRINLQVRESRIADVRVGQQGVLHLSALPDMPFDFVVSKVTPVTDSREGASYFRVEAELKGVNEQLRPGMEGVGKVAIDERRLIAIWSRELLEWLRLMLWTWWS